MNENETEEKSARDVVEHLWASYRVMVMPDDAPPFQVKECKMAFVAGMHSASGLIIAICNGKDTSEIKMTMVDDLIKAIKVVGLGAAATNGKDN